MRSTRGTITRSLFVYVAAIMVGPSVSTARADDNPESKLEQSKQQQTEEDEFLYELKAPQAVRGYDAVAGDCTGPALVAKDGLRFAVLKTIQIKEIKQLLLRFQPIKKETLGQLKAIFNSPSDQTDNTSTDDTSRDGTEASPKVKLARMRKVVEDAFITSKSNGQYFCLEKDTFDALVDEEAVVKAYRLGHTDPVYGLSLALPFKLRRATAGFNTALTEGIAIDGVLGVRWRISDTHDYHIDFPVVNAGVTTLEIEQGRAPSAMTGNKQILGLTASAGLVLELSNFQIELMAGIDRAPGDEGRGWVYNNKVWYSFGFGYAFLKNSSK